MDNPFKFWSEVNPKSKETLKPNLGLRKWNDLEQSEKESIWLNLKLFTFDLVKDKFGYITYNHYFLHGIQKQNVLIRTIHIFNGKYKALNLCKRYISSTGSRHDSKIECAEDFMDIFFKADEDKVYELLSIYIYEYIDTVIKSTRGEKRDEIIKEKIDEIIKYIEDTFSQFSIEYKLTKNGFTPRQEEKLFELAYEPTLQILGDQKWSEVEKYIGKAFENYKSKKYGDVIMNCSSAIQNFLQIAVNGEIGKGEIPKLFKEGESKGIIKLDVFTEELSSKFNKLLARERKEKTDAHVELEEATEKDALYILNLTIIHLQNWLT